jgi:competence protein ComEC
MAAAPAPVAPELEPLARAPLVPVALAATGGVLLDRGWTPALAFWLASIVTAVLLATIFTYRNRPFLVVLMLWLAAGALGGAYHHWRREVYPASDISHIATADRVPAILRGEVATEPWTAKRATYEDLRSFPSPDAGRFVLAVQAVKSQNEWQAASGLVSVFLGRPQIDLHVGDEVELAGRLATPPPPANPGEFDFASSLADQGIRATLAVKDDPTDPDFGGAVILGRGPEWSFDRLLARVRAWGQRTLMTYLPPERHGVAIALLLGEGAPMAQDDWEKYARTGVIHVLAISGQHLVVLAAFLSFFLRLTGMRLRGIAVTTTIILLVYALLVGGRPPVMRSVASVAIIAGGLWLRRPLLPANIFAFAWLVVLALNPSDLFTSGCQLSFLSVAVLYWGMRGWAITQSPLTKLVDQVRPVWLRALRWFVHATACSYAITVAIQLVLAPLITSSQNLVSPVGILIGPPTVLLTTIALLAGFAVLFFAILIPPAAALAAHPADWSLAGCEQLVGWAAQWPGAFWYVPSLPTWWLWLFYVLVLANLMSPAWRRAWRLTLAAFALLIPLGLVAGAVRPSDEFRCTFLAVGHGGCVVIEPPDGRVLLYDTGSLSGPEVARRQIAPYLWHRGFRRIDEILLSHADLDHFNGLVLLLDRFAVGQVTCTPTFQDRQTAAVRRTLRELESRGVPIRIVSTGQHLNVGSVSLDVVHPPPEGPAGNENARSLVLAVRYEGRTILLTGDLEGPGLQRVLALPAIPADVLMAPHHGNRAATAPLAEWASAKVIVSCNDSPRGKSRAPAGDEHMPPWFGTWPHGAVTFRMQSGELLFETFASRIRRRL